MTEISFEQISSFCKYVDQEKKKQDSKNKQGFHPVILMSFDVERVLLDKAWSQFYEDEFGRKSFRGVPFYYIVADGFLSFCWEADE